jgi:hypothetical protein
MLNKTLGKNSKYLIFSIFFNKYLKIKQNLGIKLFKKPKNAKYII